MAKKVTRFWSRVIIQLDGTKTYEDLTVQEIAVKKSNAADHANYMASVKAVEDQKATDKASAKVKLKAAEYTPLTDAEVDALTK